jgi:integrase
MARETSAVGGRVAAPSYPRGFRSFNYLGGYASELKPLLKRAELPPIRFHDLRHTCATILLMAGKHPKYVQELLGHASINITLDTYSHVIEGMDGGLADAMDDTL